MLDSSFAVRALVVGVGVCFGMVWSSCGSGKGSGDDVDASLDQDGSADLDAAGDGAAGDGGGDADGGNPSAAPGNCPDQPETPAPGSIAQPVFNTSFGTNGGYRGSPQVLDVDGDGDLDVLASEFGTVTAYDVDGTQLWQENITGRNFSGLILADLDGSGLPEVVAGDNGGNVHAWYADGSGAVNGWPVQVRLAADVRSLAAADVDDDGRDEVIVFSSLTDQGSQPNMYIYEGDGSVYPGWPHYGDGDPVTGHACDWCGGFNQNVAVGDLDGDGTLDVVFTQDRYSVSVFDVDGVVRNVDAAFDWCSSQEQLHWGEVRTYIPYNAEFSAVCGDSFTHILEFTYSPPLIADLDHDGTAEILAVPNIEESGNIGPIVGSALGVYEPDRTHRPGFAPYPVGNGSLYPGGGWHEVNPTVVAANFRGDRTLEVLAVHLDGTARLYDAAGTELWSWTWSSTDNCLATEPLVADLDQDHVPEAIVVVSCGAGTSTLAVLGGEDNGQPRMTATLPFDTIASPLIVDLDSDQELELLFSSEDWTPSIHVYDWPGTGTECVIWPQGRGNPAHTGALR